MTSGDEQEVAFGVVTRVHVHGPMMEVKTDDGRLLRSHPRHVYLLREDAEVQSLRDDWRRLWVKSIGRRCFVVGGEDAASALRR